MSANFPTEQGISRRFPSGRLICSTLALVEAAKNNHTEIVRMLIEAKADVNAKSSDSAGGYAPISIAGDPL